MKNFMVVPVLLLVLLVAFVGTSFATSRPYDYHDLITPDGDDHPWGGEQYSTVTPLKTSSTGRYPVITAIGPLDIIFGAFLEIFYPQPRPEPESDTQTKTSVQAASIPVKGGSTATTINRGN